MIKTLYIVTSVVSVFIASLFFLPDQEVTITQSVLDEVVPGQNFVVTLTINKGNIDGFAQLQQYIPEGFTALNMESGDAKFSSEGHFVKITWFALPADPVITVSYAIIVDGAASGTKKLTGVFSYIEKDKTKTVNITPATIKVSSVAEALAALNGEAQQPATESTASANAIEISRHMPDRIAEGEGFDVELTVRNKSIQGSSKLVEHIPSGWVATKGETAGALFKVQDSLVKFIWLALPADSVFKVTYHVVPSKNTAAVQDIYGTFAFDDHGMQRAFDYFPSQVSVAYHELNVATQKTQQQDPVGEAIKESIAQQPTQEVLLAQATNIPTPETGIIFRVQIAACRKAVKDVTYFNNHYKLEGDVSTEMHQGWYKYVIGTCDKYGTARELRARASDKVAGVFVVAYNNGERIPVREALNVTKQKWVQ